MTSQGTAAQSSTDGTARSAWGLAALAVLVVAGIAWHRTPFGSFHYDDHANVLRDPATRDLGALLDRWATGFRPLLRTSYFADGWLWGERAGGFLLTNLVIHLLNALAVMGLASRRGLGAGAATIAALAFALQPAQAEAVAYVSGRSSSLMTLGLLCGLLAHDRAATAESPRARLAWLLAGFGAFAAAVSVKEVALVFPLLVGAWLWTSPRRPPLRLLFAAHLVGVALVALLALRSERLRDLIEFSLATLAPGRALATNAAALPGFVALWLRPDRLSIEHLAPAPTPLAIAAGAGGIALAIAVGIGCARRAPQLALALLWVPISLLPTNSVIFKLDPVSERSLYLAWVGPAFAIGAAWAVRGGALRQAARWAAVLGLSLGAFAVHQRLAVWEDSRRLWLDGTRKAPSSARAWNNLGMAYWEHDEMAPARAAFRRALELDPGDADAFQNLMLMGVLGTGGGRGGTGR